MNGYDRIRPDIQHYTTERAFFNDGTSVPRNMKVQASETHVALLARLTGALTLSRITGRIYFSAVIEPYGEGEHLLRNRSFGK